MERIEEKLLLVLCPAGLNNQMLKLYMTLIEKKLLLRLCLARLMNQISLALFSGKKSWAALFSRRMTSLALFSRRKTSAIRLCLLVSEQQAIATAAGCDRSLTRWWDRWWWSTLVFSNHPTQSTDAEATNDEADCRRIFWRGRLSFSSGGVSNNTDLEPLCRGNDKILKDWWLIVVRFVLLLQLPLWIVEMVVSQIVLLYYVDES